MTRSYGGVLAVLLTAICPATAVAGDASVGFATPGEHAFVVPQGVSVLQVEAIGARGGASHEVQGGLGARIFGTLPATAGEALYAVVDVGGGAGGPGTAPGGPGGGASDVRRCAGGGCDLASRLLVAGGGGGAGGTNTIQHCGQPGGNAGTTAEAGTASEGTGGQGATSGAGGAGGTGDTATSGTAGGLGTGGAGGSDSGRNGGGGGGGGWYGGGGGAAWNAPQCGSGGGAGSSYVDGLTDGSVRTATEAEQASVTFSYSESVAPAVAMGDPQGTSSTRTFGGKAGLDTGDIRLITVAVYSGQTATGGPVTEKTVMADAQTGDWQVSSGSLQPGAYTAQARQKDAADNTGLSEAHTFTVAAPAGTKQDQPEVSNRTQPGSTGPTTNAKPGARLPTYTLRSLRRVKGGLLLTVTCDKAGFFSVAARRSDRKAVAGGVRKCAAGGTLRMRLRYRRKSRGPLLVAMRLTDSTGTWVKIERRLR